MTEHSGSTKRRDLVVENDNGNGNQRANGHGPPAGAEPGAELPGDVRRTIAAKEAPEPIWYVGRVGPSVQDVLDAQGEELAHLERRVHEPNGNGAAPSRRQRHPE
jgi:hypothetical protein